MDGLASRNESADLGQQLRVQCEEVEELGDAGAGDPEPSGHLRAVNTFVVHGPLDALGSVEKFDDGRPTLSSLFAYTWRRFRAQKD